MLYMRGHSADYDAWRDEDGMEGWGYSDLLPHFRRSEDLVSLAGDESEMWHGRGGEMGVTKDNYKEPITAAFMAAGAELGYGVGDLNGEMESGGFSPAHVTMTRGERLGTFRAFAERWEGAGLTVLPFSLASRVVGLHTGRATGLELIRFGRTEHYSATREVILSAGSIGSPHLLQLSGVGDRDQLVAAGVEPVLHLPGVGANLQDHLCLGLSFDTEPGQALDPVIPPAAVLEYLSTGGGPLSSMGCSALAQVKTELQDPTDPRPDIQLHLLAISSSTDYGHQLFYNLGYKDVVWPWIAPHTGHSSAMVMPTLSRPRSRGSVTLRSPDPAQPPAIQPNYLADPHDRQVLLAAVNLSLALVDTAALRGIGATLWGEDELCGSRGLGLEFGTTAYWDCYISQYTATIYHPVGTCAMGTVLDNRWVYSIFSKDI